VPDEEELARARAKAQQEEACRAQQKRAAPGAEPDSRTHLAATAVPVGGPLALKPVTLVFKDIRYFVPNPEAEVKRAKGDGGLAVPAPVLAAGAGVGG
jgi:hypothetical protein